MQDKTLEVSHEILRGVLNSLQKNADDKMKADISSLFAEQINNFMPHTPICKIPPEDKSIRDNTNYFKENGCIAFEELLSEQEVKEIRNHLEDCPVFNGHVFGSSDKVPRKLDEDARKFPFGVYQLRDLIKAPHIIRLANNPRILSIVTSNFGCLPTIFSMNAFWSFQGSTEKVHPTAKYTQFFHRDRDDFKFCTLFLYLTDVDMANGPHQFIRTSHNPEKFKNLVRQEKPSQNTPFDKIYNKFKNLVKQKESSQDIPFEKIYSEFFDEATLDEFPVLNKFIETMIGKAGTGILANVSGLHRGLPPVEGDRLLVWIRYGLYQNVHTSLKPHNFPRNLVPDGDFLDQPEYQYINRNFFK